MRHDELPEAHKEALRERDIDPDDRWTLIYSFENAPDAAEELVRCESDAAEWETFRIVDALETKAYDRPVC